MPNCLDNFPTCSGGVPNGVCQSNEDCNCPDCFSEPQCTNNCVNDGVCGGFEGTESCTCPDCDVDAYCRDPVHCNHDGFCDSTQENCACDDCWGEFTCQDNINACKNHQPNGVCEAGETCACPDCATGPGCYPSCPDTTSCTLYDDCTCAASPRRSDLRLLQRRRRVRSVARGLRLLGLRRQLGVPMTR